MSSISSILYISPGKLLKHRQAIKHYSRSFVYFQLTKYQFVKTAHFKGPRTQPPNKMEFPPYTKTFHSKSYPAISPTRPELSTAGKVVLITGGGSGIGPSITNAFAV